MSRNPLDCHHQTWHQVPHGQKRQENAESLRAGEEQRHGPGELAVGAPEPVDHVVHRGHGREAGPERCGGPQAFGHQAVEAVPLNDLGGEAPSWTDHVQHQLEAQMCQQHPGFQGRADRPVGDLRYHPRATAVTPVPTVVPHLLLYLLRSGDRAHSQRCPDEILRPVHQVCAGGGRKPLGSITGGKIQAGARGEEGPGEDRRAPQGPLQQYHIR